MKKFLFAALTAAFGLVAAAPAWAGPAFCTGTTQTVASLGQCGRLVPGGDRQLRGSRRQSLRRLFRRRRTDRSRQRKLHLLQHAGQCNDWVLGAIGASSSGILNYSVAVDPALSQGFLITGLEKDFTLNSNNGGLASANLQGITTPATNPPVAINCTPDSEPHRFRLPGDPPSLPRLIS